MRDNHPPSLPPPFNDAPPDPAVSIYEGGGSKREREGEKKGEGEIIGQEGDRDRKVLVIDRHMDR